MHPQVSHIAAKLIDSQLPGSYFGENIVRQAQEQSKQMVTKESVISATAQY